MPACVIVDKRPLEYAFRDKASVNTTSATSYTFSSLSFGPADDERYIVIGVGQAVVGSAFPTSVTIGGVTATTIVTSSAGATNRTAALYYAFVPTGTTGSVVLNYASAVSRSIRVFVYSMSPWVSVASTATAGNGVFTPITLSASLNIQARGVVIGVAQANSTSVNATWTNLTEDWETTGAETATSASSQFGTDQTGLSVQVDFSAASTAAAAWAVFAP